MLRINLWLSVGVCVWGGVFCSIKCPDGNICSDYSTCCLTNHGYSCCPYPKAMCCHDLTHCCPQGFRCNLIKQMCEKTDQPWMSIPMVKKEPAQEPAQEPSTSDMSLTPFQEPSNVPEVQKSSVVRCDQYYVCPDFTTCCKHPKGVWFCCNYNHGKCCADGYHCCPYGYDCDLTYTHCVREGFKYPFSPKPAQTSVPASLLSMSDDDNSGVETPMTAVIEASSSSSSSSSSSPEHGLIRCDSSYYCPVGSTCCKGQSGQWTCCPYPLGTCCADGKHCCQYGYTCDPSSSVCRRLWIS